MKKKRKFKQDPSNFELSFFWVGWSEFTIDAELLALN